VRPTTSLRLKRIGLFAAGLLVLLMGGLAGAAAALDHGLLDRAVARLLSAKLGRPVSFTALRTRLLTASPTVEVRGLRIGNPAWAGPGDMATVRRLFVRLPFASLAPSELTVDGADARLVQIDRDRANWRSGGGGDPLGGVERLIVTDSRVRLDDRLHGILLDGRVEHDPRRDPRRPLKVTARGNIQGGGVTLTASGAALNGRPRGAPYRMAAALTDGAVRMEAEGEFDKPFSFKGFDLTVKASGPNLVALEYLFDLGTPNSTPFTLTGRIRRDGEVTRATDLAARIGDSDFKGQIVSDGSSGRRLITIELASERLTARDVASFLETKPPHAVARVVPGTAGKKGPRLFSPKPLNLARFNRRDAVLKLSARRFESGVLAPGRLRAEGRLEDGVFRLSPIEIALPSGRLRGDYTLDVRKPEVGMSVDLSIAGGRVADAFPAVGDTLDGAVRFRARASGAGLSVGKIVAAAKGDVSLRVTDGDIKRPAAKLLSGAVVEAAFASLASKDAVSPLACLVAKADIGGGRIAVRDVLMVTEAGSTTARGGADLVRETVDLRLYGRPRRFTLFRTDRPAAVEGPLVDPKVVVRPKSDGADPPKPPKIEGEPAAFCRAVAF
jgi:uncharacterized protein involved in outer membrane biogenesis